MNREVDREPGRDHDGSLRTSAPALPNDRLNPLLNPLLAKQLGRWAHIYYTASVNNREAAIEKLVCELEAEEAKLHGTRDAPAPAPPTERASGPVLVVAPRTAESVPDPVKPWPLFSEPEVAELGADGSMSTQAPIIESFHAQEAVELQTPAESRILETEATPESSKLPASSAEPYMERAALPAPAAEVPVWEPSPRERYGLETITTPDLFSSPASTRSWRRPLAAMGLVALLGIGLSLAWQRSKSSAGTQQAHRSQPSSSPLAVRSETASAPPAASVAPAAASVTPAAAGVTPGKAILPETVPPTAEEIASKDPDLVAGLRLLKGTSAGPNSAEAVPHLWQAVKRQNAVALVTLAELFAQGEGVTKDCDQAKILFGAAERQAKTSPQLQRIETARGTLRTSGCE